MAENVSKTLDGATDPAKNPLGGRKPDGTATEVSKTDPSKAVAPVTNAGAPGEKKEPKESSLRIHIELDIDVEVHLTARVKGDITIGLL